MGLTAAFLRCNSKSFFLTVYLLNFVVYEFKSLHRLENQCLNFDSAEEHAGYDICVVKTQNKDNCIKISSRTRDESAAINRRTKT